MNDDPSAEIPVSIENDKQKAAVLRKIAERMAGALLPIKSAERSILPNREQLFTLSEEWRRLRRTKWTETDQKFWDQLVEACCKCEKDDLRKAKVPKNRIENEVRREWAYWDPRSGRFVTSPGSPSHGRAAPVVVVPREGSSSIHPELLCHLWDHPVLAMDVATASQGGWRNRFQNMLRWVESIAAKHDLTDWEQIPILAGQEGEDQRAAACLLSELDLQIALETRSANTGGLIEPETEADETEDLTWLAEAKGGQHLWRLLTAAINFGRDLEHYSVLRNSSIEETTRKMLTANPGKRVTPEGKAVEKIIKAFREQKPGKPTAVNLRKFLKVEPPANSTIPLEVDHELWVEDLKAVSWSHFKSLVKAANRRLRQ